MTRKLPWETSGASAKPPTRRPATAAAPSPRPNQKRPTPLDSDSDAIPPPKKQPKRQSSREPSTSPPPTPPTDKSPMRPGYNADDIHKMVEDEFHATAQSFTRHLHHAEYVRLQKLARTRPPSRDLPPLPGDARDEVKRKFQTMELQGRQGDALVETGAREKDVEAEAEVEVRDPWAGTHLAGLMGKGAGDRERTALVGLQGVPSKTRAAKGFGRGEGDNLERKENGSFDGPAEGSTRTEKGLKRRPFFEAVEGGDDQESGSTTHHHFSKPTAPPRVPNGVAPQPPEVPKNQPFKPKPRPVRRKAFDDDFDMDAISPVKPIKPKHSQNGKIDDVEERKKRKEKEMKARFREIPEFLI